jgi:carboxyl-terminal processing protease
VAGVGDPYTSFFDPETAEEFNQELAGTFEGIGAEIGLREGQIVVIAPLPGTPAERAGLLPWDRIVEIDGRSTSGLSVEAAVSAIRGKHGTTVTLMVVRSAGDPLRVEIVRETITIESVESSLKAVTGSPRADIAYLKINHFNDDTASDFATAVQEVLGQHPRGVILDLRSNPGGLLETAVAVASYWVDDGPVVIQQQSGGRRTEEPAKGTALLKGLPTIVLVNGGSASASEIVAGSLQDYGLATVVGETTFGKGSVQELRDLADGSAVKITMARWLTPKGRAIEGVGIEPDVAVAVDRQELREGEDPELDRALELLR